MAVGTAKSGTPNSATGACCRSCASPGCPASTAPTSRKCLRCFTDSEWAAARELVLLSAGTVSYSALPSAATLKRPDPSDELRGGPSARRQRRRTLASLYEATSPVGGSGLGDGNPKKRQRSSGDSNGHGNGDGGCARAIRRDGR